MTEHPLDDLAAYELRILDADEQRAIGAHLAGCATCRAESAALAETVWRVSETAGRDVPDGLRSAIVARARRDGAAIAAPRPSFWSGLFRPVPLAVPLALVLVLLVAVGGYGSARRDADRFAAALSTVAGARVVPLAAAGPNTGIRGSLVVPANGAKPYLLLDLPSAPAGKTWEAWVIRGDVAVRAGITDDRGVTTLELAAPLGAGDTVAITAEAAGGVDSPTSAPVLAGKS